MGCPPKQDKGGADSSVYKVFAMQAGRPEFRFPAPTEKLGGMVRACNPSTRQMKTGGSLALVR